MSYEKTVIDTCTDCSILVEMDVSDDGIAWAGWTSGPSQFFTHFRYVRVKLTLTAADADSFVRIENVKVELSVKMEMDGNDIECLASDANGTEVQLPGDVSAGHGVKTFKDISSITLDPKTTEPLTAIYDFVDIPDPVHFYIYVFDASGRRVDALVSWKVRGAV